MNPAGISMETDFPTKESYLWEAPGKPVSIEIDFDVVDRMSRDIQRGFVASTRRGLEIGGILLGSVTVDDKLTVRIEDFEPVPCSYVHGASYIVDGGDGARFEQAVAKWKPASGRHLHAVGFFRAHTRDGLSLDRNDRELIDRHFPEESGIALLVKPEPTGAAQAGYFFREGGRIRKNVPLRVFPFRREELGGGQVKSSAVEDAVNGHKRTNGITGAGGAGQAGFSGQDEAAARQDTPATAPPPADGSDQTAVPKRTLRLRGGWVWVPLSFVFLLLGTILGFQVALSVRSQVPPTRTPDPFTLSLSATPSAESIHLRWDRVAPAVKVAQRGVLIIHEDGAEKNVDLDAGHLRNGSVIYRRASNNVSFRLEVFLKDGVTVSETVDFRPIVPESQPAEERGD